MEPGLFLPVLIAWAQVQSEVMGRKECRKNGVGAIIRKLRGALPANGVGPLFVERLEAAQILESNCRLCGKCKEMRGPVPEAFMPHLARPHVQ